MPYPGSRIYGISLNQLVTLMHRFSHSQTAYRIGFWAMLDPMARPAVSALDSQQARALVQLRDLILKGEFNPGERLAEVTLAARLGVSRTPVRLALATLEREGLVAPSGSVGYVMRRFT